MGIGVNLFVPENQAPVFEKYPLIIPNYGKLCCLFIVEEYKSELGYAPEIPTLARVGSLLALTT
jgi:hypothetical protein